MKEDPDIARRHGLLVDILQLGQGLVKLAGTYVLLIREEVREEAKALGRRAALAAALLVIFIFATILFSIGIGRVLDVWIGLQGIGFVIVGGFLLLLLPIGVLIMTRKR